MISRVRVEYVIIEAYLETSNSGKGGKGGKVEKPHSHNKGVGGSSLAGMPHKQGDTVGESAGPFSTEPGSAQGGSVSGEGGGLLNILSGTRWSTCYIFFSRRPNNSLE